MNGRVVLVFLFLVSVGVSLVIPKGVRYNRNRYHYFGRPSEGLVPKPVVEKSSSFAPSTDQYVTVKLDNFDPTNTNTFQQRYWYNDQWYKPGGPIFIMIGGESAESPNWLSTDKLIWTGLAESNNAFGFILEHRYYGKSAPFNGDQSTANLKYLSSEQALADLAAFIPTIRTTYNLTGPVITFGGSYSGALSAWARMKYPDLVFGAVGSSGPVQAVVDMVGYLETVMNDLNNVSAGCGSSVQNAMSQIQQLMGSANGRQQLFKGFKLCQPIDPTNGNMTINFYQTVIGNYMGIAQYSKDNAGQYATELTINNLCAIQTNSTGTDLSNTFAVNNWMMSFYGESCTDIDWNEFLQYMQQPGDYRLWFYQTCTEFGFYQSTDSTTSFWGNTVPVAWFVAQCATVYGSQFGNTTVYDSIDATNNGYGGQSGYNATRVVLPNGSHDPWHVLGVLTSPNPSATAIVIEGTSHCADMYADNPSLDPPQLTAARVQIRSIVNSWLQS